jgi:hypothetical protein
MKPSIHQPTSTFRKTCEHPFWNEIHTRPLLTPTSSDQSTGGAEHARENLVDPKEVKVIPIPTINLVNSFAHVNLDFSVGLTFDIKKAGGLHDAALKKGIQDLYIMVEAKEELRVQLQAEILAKFGVDVYCSLWLFPVPGKFSCVGGPMIANQQFLFPIPGLSGGPPMPNQFPDIVSGARTSGMLFVLSYMLTLRADQRLRIRVHGRFRSLDERDG